MIVFGDPQFNETFSTSVARLREQVRLVNPDSLDDLRALLVVCGQIEQAVSDCDAFKNSEFEKCFQKITDDAAHAFCAVWRENSNITKSTLLTSLRQELAHIDTQCDPMLTLKIPEGYEFYSLFPEQYCVSAERWATEQNDAKHVLIVGVRSIGTSLSAVVADTLNSAGFQTNRTTVRPTGNPFQRTFAFPKNLSPEIRHALVVDEGPGISGSTMAAVADGLLAAGIPRENIFFFPGHDNPPGAQASETIRRWWDLAPHYFTPLSNVRWRGKSLRELLLEKSAGLLPSAGTFESFNDLSNGLWRKFVYENESDWPAVCHPFERAKFLCRTRGVGVLWKFDGLGSRFSNQQKTKNKSAQLGSFHGFTATRWIDGAPTNRRAATPEIGKILATHLDHVAGPMLSVDEMDSGIERLSEMTRRNISNAVPELNESEIEFLADGARNFFQQNPHDKTARSYGDGRMAPQEWIRSPKEIFKTDIGGHDADHTMVGRQSVLWDIAGVLVEWNLAKSVAVSFFDELQQRGMRVDENALQFFELCYAAFRFGQCSLCAEINGHDEAERRRLLRGAEFYRRHLANFFKRRHSAATLARQNRQSQECLPMPG